MSAKQTVLEKGKQWATKRVTDIHKQFDDEFDLLEGDKDAEELIRRFFGFTGIVEETLRELAGSSDEPKNVLETACELVTFRAYIYACFFLNQFPEDVVREWWEGAGFRSWAEKSPFSIKEVVGLQSKFDTAVEECADVVSFQKLKDAYMGPRGEFAKVLVEAEKRPTKEHLAIGSELFNLKSYIDYTLYAVELSSKASQWTDPQVRGLLYQFERDLFLAEGEEDVKKVIDEYVQKAKGLMASATQDKKKEEQIQMFVDALHHFKAKQVN